MIFFSLPFFFFLSLSSRFHQTQPVGRSGLVLTAWVSQWRGQRCGSRGGGGDDVDLAVEELQRGVGLTVEGRQRGSRGGGGDGVGLAVEGVTTWIL